MIKFPKSLAVWGTKDFDLALKAELKNMGVEQLPLQQALVASNHALDDDLEVTVLNTSEQDDEIHAKVGIFFTGVIAGCSCADDPTPVEAQTEYCEIELLIDKATAEAKISLV